MNHPTQTSQRCSRYWIRMSLRLLEGYSSDEEPPLPAANRSASSSSSSLISDASSDESDQEIDQPRRRARNFSRSDPANPPPDPSLPSALDAFSEVCYCILLACPFFFFSSCFESFLGCLIIVLFWCFCFDWWRSQGRRSS
jgi:hypothetical protein